jgi:hypothetical protein
MQNIKKKQWLISVLGKTRWVMFNKYGLLWGFIDITCQCWFRTRFWKSRSLELIRTFQILVWADDVSILDENLHTIEQLTETPLDASKNVGLEVNREKTMFISGHQNTGNINNVRTNTKLFKNVT